ncbi:MAG TPA: site-2 protease family protein [Acidimicrobiales bacterium]|nr:site-2 protease family protein [Acidimicrobiales bacterium]
MQRTRRTPRRWSIPVLRVGGITVRLHVTFIALVALVAFAAASAGESAVGAVGWLAALFACVIVHELAHSLVARRKGVAVHEIDLLPIGGVSRLERIPENWRDETVIAAAGPAASVVVALVAFGAAALAGTALWPPTVFGRSVLVRLGWVNLLLAAFNLVPAFPLDGGRVFRALLERGRSRGEATRIAARISRAFAVAMIAIGFLYNLWLIVIGLFVIVAGRAEEAAVLVHEAIAPLPAEVAALPCLVKLPVGASAQEARRVAETHPQPAYAVVDGDGHVVGSVAIATVYGLSPERPLEAVMSTSSVECGTSLEDVLPLVSDGPVIVQRGAEVVGIITAATLDAQLQDRLRAVTN